MLRYIMVDLKIVKGSRFRQIRFLDIGLSYLKNMVTLILTFQLRKRNSSTLS